MNKEEYIFPIDCSKENIRYLLDIGCRVVVTITYKNNGKYGYCTNTCEIKYLNPISRGCDECHIDILKMSSTTPEYFWNHYEFPLYINRNDLL